MVDLIEKKKRGQALTPAELTYIAAGAGDGSIPDYQLSAWLMAVCFQGMDAGETAAFTKAMAASGSTVDLSGIHGMTADKHSTGGVGDKTTLIVAPIAACCGLKIPKMSGRGLGHTGGTIDKLESIPGLSTSFTPEEFAAIVNRNGLCIAGQAKGLDPADKRLYALRDVTATVDCLPLIASSIMSKKLAGGAAIIVLDVKYGSGALMKTAEQAEALARTMVDIGKAAGRRMTAVVTDMNVPLGHAVGNLLEVAEAARMLYGNGDSDLWEVCRTLAVRMLMCAGHTEAEAREMVMKCIQDGSALQKLAETVEIQGGNPDWIRDPQQMPTARFRREFTAARDGYLTAFDTEKIGLSAMLLGAGRSVLTDAIVPTAGLLLKHKPGDRVCAGEPIAIGFAEEESRFAAAQETFASAIAYAVTPPTKEPLIHEIIQ